MHTPSQIITMLQNREEQALGIVRGQYGGLCFRIAQQMLGSAEDAEECLNDTLLALWNSVPPHEPQNLEAYLVTLLRRTAMDRLRQTQSIKRGGGRFAEVLEELAEALPAAEDVEAECSRRLMTDAVKACLDTLPEKTQRIFLQRYLLSMSLQEIAADNGVPLSTVKTGLHRTRKLIREYLEKEGYHETV